MLSFIPIYRRLIRKQKFHFQFCLVLEKIVYNTLLELYTLYTYSFLFILSIISIFDKMPFATRYWDQSQSDRTGRGARFNRARVTDFRASRDSRLTERRWLKLPDAGRQ